MRECTPTREESRALGRDHALIPVYREVLADMLTPVRAYSLLCPPGQPGFLLESVEGGERLARFSFIGFQPRPIELGDGNPLDALSAVAGEVTAPVKGIPRFHGGAVGYLGYETARHFERRAEADRSRLYALLGEISGLERELRGLEDVRDVLAGGVDRLRDLWPARS